MTLFGNTPQETRQVFYTCWEKHLQHQPLHELEQQVVNVILMHPEYHELLTTENAREATFFPELGQVNPFLHMGLHLAIRDQIATDRPEGIKNVYTRLIEHYKDHETVEHLMMDCLAERLWIAQKNQCMPKAKTYLAACQEQIK